jgi:hypothetical protein
LVAFSADSRKLDRVVHFVADIARALSGLHKEGIYHRDIKPENLFVLSDDTAAIGDFGLVDFPDKVARTEADEMLGSRFYLAPEISSGTPDHAAGPVDVYALAKTLWVLATGQTYPPPGELRTDIDQVRLSAHTSNLRASILDLLIDRATRHTASSRPSMDEVVAELDAWLFQPQRPAGPLEGISQYASRVEIALSRENALRQKRVWLHKRATGILSDLKKEFEALAVHVRGAIPGLHVTVDGTINAILNAFPKQDMGKSHERIGECSLGAKTPDNQHGASRALRCGFVVYVDYDNQSAKLDGGYFVIGVGRGGGVLRTIWQHSTQFQVGTALEELELARLAEQVRVRLGEAISSFGEVLDQP